MPDPAAATPTRTIVVMGVAGSGKSTVMHALAERLGWVCAEADDFHPAANIARMAAGTPLTDEDRWPWLAALAAWIGEQEAAGRDAIVTCSALRRVYRERLRAGHDSVWFAHLAAPREILAARIEGRRGHYMPVSLLASQLDTLEPLEPDESGITVQAGASVEATVEAVLAAVKAARPEVDLPS
jgi:gluconokinase